MKRTTILVPVILLYLVTAGPALARTWHAAFGLVPNTTYGLYRDGVPQSQELQSDAAGHAVFDSEGGGLFRIAAQTQMDLFRLAPPDSLWAKWDGETVNLRWPASPDTEAVAYQVSRQRLDRDDPFLRIKQVAELGWRDSTAAPFAVYVYSVRTNGRSGRVSGCVAEIVVSTTPGAAFARPALLGVFPNPARGRVRVDFSLDGTTAVDVWLTNVFGRRVGPRRQGLGERGINVWTLDLTGPGGSRLAAGSYFVICQAGPRRTSAHLIVLPDR